MLETMHAEEVHVMDDSTSGSFSEYLRAWGRNAAIDAGFNGSVPLMPSDQQTALLRMMYDRETAST